MFDHISGFRFHKQPVAGCVSSWYASPAFKFYTVLILCVSGTRVHPIEVR